MEILYDSASILEALYDLSLSQETLLEEIAIMKHNYKKTADMDVLTEGVGDIISLIISSVKKFIQKMKDFVVRKFLILNSYRMEYDKLIAKYGSVLAAAEFDPFDIDGFQFTVLSRPRPNTGKVYEIIEEFNATIAKFSSLTMEDIRRINNEDCSAIAFQRLRAQVLGTSDRVSQEEFKKTCYMYYRNDKEFAETMSISKDTIGDILKNSGALIAEKKTIKTDKDATMNVLNNMERFFSVKVSDLYDDVKKRYHVNGLSKGGTADTDSYALAETEMGKLTMYLSSRYQQVVELANIVSIIFVERMAAINDQMNQELQILREVLKVQGPMEGVERILEVANSYPPAPNTNWAPIWEGISDLGGEYK